MYLIGCCIVIGVLVHDYSVKICAEKDAEPHNKVMMIVGSWITVGWLLVEAVVASRKLKKDCKCKEK